MHAHLLGQLDADTDDDDEPDNKQDDDDDSLRVRRRV
jgi:hypothetical protein